MFVTGQIDSIKSMNEDRSTGTLQEEGRFSTTFMYPETIHKRWSSMLFLCSLQDIGDSGLETHIGSRKMRSTVAYI